MLEVEEECFEPWLRYDASVFDYYYKRSSIFRVAKCNGVVVGYVLADLEGPYCHIVSIAVKPGYRGRGIGSRLLNQALVECKNAGATRAYLEVSTANKPALRLYSKAGFRVVGVIKGYYGREDAYIMVKDIS